SVTFTSPRRTAVWGSRVSCCSKSLTMPARRALIACPCRPRLATPLRSRSMRRPASSPSPAWNCSASTSHTTARNRGARFSACFWTSAGPGQAACHEDGHGPVDVGFVVGGQAFVVAGAAAVAGDPCQGALDHPAAGQHLEGVGALGPFDDL